MKPSFRCSDCYTPMQEKLWNTWLCKSCQYKRHSAWVDKNRKRVNSYAVEHHRKTGYSCALKIYARNNEIIRKAKSKPCADCGIEYPFPAMQFDHVRDKKKGDICHMRSYSVKRLEAEISKCDIVCANCHQVRSYERAHRVRSVPTTITRTEL